MFNIHHPFLVWWKIAKEVEKDQVTLDFKYRFQSLEMIPKVTAGTSATWPAPGRCSSCRAARSGASSRPSTAASAWRGRRGTTRGTPRSCRPGAWTSGRCAAPGAWCRPAAETHARSQVNNIILHTPKSSIILGDCDQADGGVGRGAGPGAAHPGHGPEVLRPQERQVQR